MLQIYVARVRVVGLLIESCQLLEIAIVPLVVQVKFICHALLQSPLVTEECYRKRGWCGRNRERGGSAI